MLDRILRANAVVFHVRAHDREQGVKRKVVEMASAVRHGLQAANRRDQSEHELNVHHGKCQSGDCQSARCIAQLVRHDAIGNL